MVREAWACTTCRAAVQPGSVYIRCSVASCNAGKLKMRFCSFTCWKKHVPIARHRKASFIEVHPDGTELPGAVK